MKDAIMVLLLIGVIYLMIPKYDFEYISGCHYRKNKITGTVEEKCWNGWR